MHVDVTSSLSERLKRETRVEHERTERHPFHAQLLRGTLSKESYIAYLEQLLLLHQALLPALERAAVAHPGLVRGNDAQLSIECLKEDLDFLGGSTASTPLPATRELVGKRAAARSRADDDHYACIVEVELWHGDQPETGTGPLSASGTSGSQRRSLKPR